MHAATIKVTFRRLQNDDTAVTVGAIAEWLEANLPQTDPDNEITIIIGLCQ